MTITTLSSPSNTTNTTLSPIPKIIHQIWIGNVYNKPYNLMNTWKQHAENMGIQYILWTDEYIADNNIKFECQHSIDVIPEINGKADIMRWEILLKYGGIFIDADSLCIEPLIEDFFNPITLIQPSLSPPPDDKPPVIGFAAFENEEIRKGLVATGTMGFTRNHPLVRDIVEWLKDESITPLLQNTHAWKTVGPGCITGFLDTMEYNKTMIIFPSYYFIPVHYRKEAREYIGHEKVYAHQLWGTGEQIYKLTGGNLPTKIPHCCKNPSISVSILINSYNTPRQWIYECLNSIQKQRGLFMIELVWIDDGSSSEFSTELCHELARFQKTTRFLHPIKYHKMESNVGTRAAINHGITLCSYELIIKMDSDDIMFSGRIQKQIDFMNSNPDIICCGGQLVQFNEIDGKKRLTHTTHHPYIIQEQHINMLEWFMNHPTLCFRKWAAEEVGGYGTGQNLGEDREFEIKLFKTYGVGSLCNLRDVLIMYRIHENQLSGEWRRL